MKICAEITGKTSAECRAARNVMHVLLQLLSVCVCVCMRLLFTPTHVMEKVTFICRRHTRFSERRRSPSVMSEAGSPPPVTHNLLREVLHIGPGPEKITQQSAHFKLSKPESVRSVDSERGGETSFSLHILSEHPVKHHWTQVEHERETSRSYFNISVVKASQCFQTEQS